MIVAGKEVDWLGGEKDGEKGGQPAACVAPRHGQR